MRSKLWLAGLAIIGAFGLFAAGCTKTAERGEKHGKVSKTSATVDAGWWCNEHGVPEAECALCSTKVAADFKAKGDWCKEHDRPESQCFICHPDKEAEFAAQYEAKYGKKPPKPEGHSASDEDEKT